VLRSPSTLCNQLIIRFQLPLFVIASAKVPAQCDVFIAAWCLKPLRQMKRISFCSSGTRATARVPKVSSGSSVSCPSPA